MEPKQINSNWENKTTVIKGNLGESIVKSILEQRGYVVYKSITDGAHCFDFLAIKDKIKFIVAEVKTKGRLIKYRATGFDIRHYNEYMAVSKKHNLDVIVFFVDNHPKEKRVYCGNLTTLSNKHTVDNIEYPNCDIVKNIILFSLDDMKHIAQLTDEQVNILNDYSTMDAKYKYNI